MKTIIFCGGHHNSSIPLAKKFKNDGCNIVYVGHKVTQKRNRELSSEYKEVTALGFSFINFVSPKFYKNNNPLKYLYLFGSLTWSFLILIKYRPCILVSFGGYLALPVAFCGFLNNIPVYSHEQTISPGIANKIIGMFAKKIFLSFPESNKNWKKNKVIIIGNPIRKQIFQHHNLNWLPEDKRKIIYVTGGSLGAHSINLHIGQIINRLTEKYTVVHQTGDTKEYNDYITMNNLRLQLPLSQQKHYIIKRHIGGDEIGSVYWYCSLIVGRAGANTISELIVLKKPAILIPLPWSAGQEQLKQAKYLNNNKVVEIFDQNETSTRLLNLIEKVINSLQDYQNGYIKYNFYIQNNAAQTLANSLFT